MLRVPRPTVRGIDARRVVALLALVAVLLVVLGAAAHAAEGDHEHGGCSVCLAHLTSAVAAIVAPGLVLLLVQVRRAATFRAATVPLAARRGFLHAPRGPPTDA